MFADTVTDHLVAKASVRTEELSAKLIKDARLQGTIASGLLGAAVGNGVSAVVCTSQGLTVTDPRARIRVPIPAMGCRHDAAPACHPRHGNQPMIRLARSRRHRRRGPSSRVSRSFHRFDASTGSDQLVINHLGRYAGGVRIVGDVQVDGAVLESSSAALKDDVEPLSVESADHRPQRAGAGSPTATPMTRCEPRGSASLP